MMFGFRALFALGHSGIFATGAFAQDFCNTATHSGESVTVTSNGINDIGKMSP
jgi:endo-1,4-beta-xylanase